MSFGLKSFLKHCLLLGMSFCHSCFDMDEGLFINQGTKSREELQSFLRLRSSTFYQTEYSKNVPLAYFLTMHITPFAAHLLFSRGSTLSLVLSAYYSPLPSLVASSSTLA